MHLSSVPDVLEEGTEEEVMEEVGDTGWGRVMVRRVVTGKSMT